MTGVSREVTLSSGRHPPGGGLSKIISGSVASVGSKNLPSGASSAGSGAGAVAGIRSSALRLSSTPRTSDSFGNTTHANASSLSRSWIVPALFAMSMAGLRFLLVRVPSRTASSRLSAASWVMFPSASTSILATKAPLR